MTSGTVSRITHGGLEVAERLSRFVSDELAPGSGIEPDEFFAALEAVVRDLGPRNRELLARRDDLQERIDAWHKEYPGRPDPAAYKAFLEDIGYLEPPVGAFEADPAGIDDEIARVAGPQLVVPVDNARYALNAANARWGSLYDGFYGTDVLDESEGRGKSGAYNPVRGDAVVSRVRDLLDRHFPLERGTHRWATAYAVHGGQLVVTFGDGTATALIDGERLAGYTGDGAAPESVMLERNGLHLEIRFGRDDAIGRRDLAGIRDVRLESALSTIMDLEDSVASVDTEDKVKGYRNWLGLMLGTLEETFEKGGETVERKLSADVSFTTPGGDTATLPGRSLMLVRNAGAHLVTDAVLLDGEPIPETMLDAMVTALAGKHDLAGRGRFRNSRAGSIYIVKPKMHGSAEVALAVELFERVEQALDLAPNTLKMGIMDEERRTTVNLANCIAAARDRVFFINTGFLDRTGDEIHTCMEAGPVLPKDEMKGAAWLKAYEDWNVDMGLAAGFAGRAQIGKGMWAMPDEMAAMIDAKIGHPKAGASTAWVPSPTAATLHALHYLAVDVAGRQRQLAGSRRARLETILELPLMDPSRTLSAEAITRELENNAQGILGYVARWVGQGVGCSKVPNIDNIGLMEDCATLRISSQHIANWLHHGLLDEARVRDAMERMAAVVDRQNAGDPSYRPMSPNFDDSVPFKAALDLVLKGRAQPNGYTEFILYARRREEKSALGQ